MIQCKTRTGFECVLEDDKLNDFEIFENLCEMDNGNMSVIPRTMKALLGDKQFEALKEHIKKLEGKVTTTAFMNEATDILTMNEEIKK